MHIAHCSLHIDKWGGILTDRAVLWIWLQDCISFANAKTRAMFEFFEKPEDIVTSDEETLRNSGLFSKHAIYKILQKDFRYAKKVYTDCMNGGYGILTLFDSRYPRKLKELADCPLLLYVEGEMPDLEENYCTAIVGSRKATADSKKYAFHIAAGLALNDVIVVSGGAEGVDTAAHKGSLSCGGKTVCVMGCGLDHNYLMKNKPMRNEIAKSGAVISEYPPYMSSQRHTFVHRNRIIAGISDCTLVVQAGASSGALKTSDKAFELKRKVFFIEECKYDERFAGSNALKEQGAEAVISHADILDWYEQSGYVIKNRIRFEKYIPTEKKEEEKIPAKEKVDMENDKILQEQLTENTFMVYHTISDVPVDSDDISNKTGLSAQHVKAALTELEIMGLIKGTAGQGYIRK